MTAERWAGLLRRLGCRVVIEVARDDSQQAEPVHAVEESVAATRDDGEPGDLLVALHARRSHAAVARFARAQPGRPIVVGLAGTDVYGDIPAGSREALDSLARADRIVALQGRTALALPEEARPRVRVIYQSCELPEPLPLFEPAPGPDRFRVAVVAHLRPVKDPLAAADAAAMLAPDSRVEIVHVGEPLDPALAERAQNASRPGGHYRWVGPVAREHALALVAQSQLLCLTSLAEGGANAVTEALACRTPVVSSRIEGSLGILGEDYPGLFEPGDRADLAATLDQAARDPVFIGELRRRCLALAPLADPATELASWRALLDELAP